MSKFFKVSIFAILLAIAFVFAFSPSPVQANGGTFDLDGFHNINGRSLGLDKELPVDVYANGVKAFTFSIGDSESLSLPAGNYFIEVKLAGDTGPAIMTLGPTDIPAGVSVSIRATLGAMKSPTLRVNVK
jgi:hypothetical protein